MVATGDAFLLQGKDKRVIFVIPYLDKFSLIGTTDVPLEEPVNSTKISQDEIYYLSETYNEFFNHRLSVDDIIWDYSGIRALHGNKTTSARKLSREYGLDIQDKNMPPFISVYGGKITTYRSLAEKVTNHLKKYFKGLPKAWTSHATLPGGDLNGHTFSSFSKELINQHSKMPEELVQYYAKCYGAHAVQLLDNTNTTKDLGEHHGGYLYEKEVQYLQNHEWARTVDDILWRRTKHGLLMEQDHLSDIGSQFSY